jgi:tetratricopeptide (TPR) repeat protein
MRPRTWIVACLLAAAAPSQGRVAQGDAARVAAAEGMPDRGASAQGEPAERAAGQGPSGPSGLGQAVEEAGRGGDAAGSAAAAEELFAAGRYEEAAQAFRSAASAAPKVALLQYDLAVALWRAGRFDEAEEAIERYAAMPGGGRMDLYRGLLGNLSHSAAEQLLRQAIATATQEGADATLREHLPAYLFEGRLPTPPATDPAAADEGNWIGKARELLDKARGEFVRAASDLGAGPQLARNLERSQRLIDAIDSLPSSDESQQSQDGEEGDSQEGEPQQNPSQSDRSDQQEQQQEQSPPDSQQGSAPDQQQGDPSQQPEQGQERPEPQQQEQPAESEEAASEAGADEPQQGQERPEPQQQEQPAESEEAAS